MNDISRNSITELTLFYNRYSLTLDCISPRAFLVILPFVMIIIQQENTQDSACVSIFESRGLFSILLKGILKSFQNTPNFFGPSYFETALVASILDSRKTYCLFMGLEILAVVGLGII